MRGCHRSCIVHDLSRNASRQRDAHAVALGTDAWPHRVQWHHFVSVDVKVSENETQVDEISQLHALLLINHRVHVERRDVWVQRKLLRQSKE